MDVFAVWFFLRILTLLWVALASPIRPLTGLEAGIALWPPVTPLATWLERVFLAPLLRWDAHWYVKIITQGYNPGDGTATFHPLYPWLATIPARIGIHPLLSLLLVASLSSLALLWSFERLARYDLTAAQAKTSVLLLLFFPLSLSVFIPYTEALFLLLAVVVFLLARRGYWGWAGLVGALAVLTRQHGIFLCIPMAWELWEASNRKFSLAIQQWTRWGSLALLPAAMLAWILYRGIIIGEFQGQSPSIDNLIKSLLISPSAEMIAPNYHFIWPWQTLLRAVDKLLHTADVDLWTNLVLALLFTTLAALAWPRLRTSYKLYTLVIVLVAFSYYTGETHPIMGLPRHLFLAFPVFLGIAPLFDKPWKRIGYSALGLTGMLFLLLQYVLESWVP